VKSDMHESLPQVKTHSKNDQTFLFVILGLIAAVMMSTIVFYTFSIFK